MKNKASVKRHEEACKEFWKISSREILVKILQSTPSDEHDYTSIEDALSQPTKTNTFKLNFKPSNKINCYYENKQAAVIKTYTLP